MTEDTTQSSDAQYTVDLNGKRYTLNEEARSSIQERARNEYEENDTFDCFWKVASPEQYPDGEWSETIHDAGDPILVISTRGPIVPWERLDTLNVEMQDAGEDTGMDHGDDQTTEKDNGNGLRTLDPDSLDDTDKVVGRTHFGLTPQSFEEVPSPDGEEEDKVPAKPEELGDDPSLVTWIPDHPDVEHSWGAGEAICSMFNRVEWNVQKKADQPPITKDKDDSHDHWESLLGLYDCEKIGELGPSQRPAPENSEQQDDDDVPEHFKEGKYGGDNWAI